MPKLEIAVSHKLTQDEALARIKRLVASAKVQYSSKTGEIEESWNGYVGSFSGRAGGATASGTITVNPSSVVLDLTLPFIVMLAKGQIESGVREHLSRILA